MDKDFSFPLMLDLKQTEKPRITIGYYKLRGKAQVPRLLCEYLGVPYEDKLYDLKEWEKYRRQQTKNWDFPDLPYLKEDDFIVTQAFPMSQYIIERFGNLQMLGKNQNDQGIVDMYLWTINTMNSVISINCTNKNRDQQEQFKQKQWKNSVYPQLIKYQEFIKEDGWFLGYLTIVDFSIYELMRYMHMLFPNQLGENLPKLSKISEKIYQLQAIQKYQNSSRAITDMDPFILKAKILAEQSTN